MNHHHHHHQHHQHHQQGSQGYQQHSHNNSHTQQSQQQRKRIAQSACELCRKKRTRCVVDPENPYNVTCGETRGFACNSCISQSVECVFSGVDRRKESVRELRARLAFLEGLFDRLRSLAAKDSGSSSSMPGLDEWREVLARSEPSEAAISMAISNGYVRGAGAPSSSNLPSGNGGDTKPSKEALAQALGHQDSTGSTSSRRPQVKRRRGSSINPDKSRIDDYEQDLYSEDEESNDESDHAPPDMSPTDKTSTGAHNSLNQTRRGRSPSSSDPNEVGDPFAANLSDLVDRLAISTDGSIHAYGAVSNIVFANEQTNHNLSPGPMLARSLPSGSQNDQRPPTKPNSNSSSANASTYSSTSPAQMTRSAPPQISPSSTFTGGRPLPPENASYLPPGTTMQTIQHLLNLYFMWHHCSFPVLSRPIFVEHLCNGGKYASPLLLNAILAFASGFSDWKSVRTNPDDPYTAGDAFFNLAKELLDSELQEPTICTVQALSLMAAREAAFARDMRGWLYSGMCGRIALDLGLHLDVSNLVAKGILTEEDQYVRQRTFWGVFVFDKEYSAIIGRPSSVRNILITCRKPGYWPGEDYDWFASAKSGYIVPLPEGAPPSAGTMFLAELGLNLSEIYDIGVHQIYFRGSYRHSVQKEHVARLEKTMALTRKVMANLPPLVVKDENAKDQEGNVDESRVLPGLVFMYTLYHSHVALLNRPFFAQDRKYGTNKAQGQTSSSNSSSSSSIKSSDGLSPRDRCYEAALEIIKLVGVFKRVSGCGFRVASNIMQHALVNAATIMILESSSSTTGSEPGDIERKHKAQTLLREEALVYLEEMAEYRPAARRALMNLREVVSDREKQEKQKLRDLAMAAMAAGEAGADSKMAADAATAGTGYSPISSAYLSGDFSALFGSQPGANVNSGGGTNSGSSSVSGSAYPTNFDENGTYIAPLASPGTVTGASYVPYGSLATGYDHYHPLPQSQAIASNDNLLFGRWGELEEQNDTSHSRSTALPPQSSIQPMHPGAGQEASSQPAFTVPAFSGEGGSYTNYNGYPGMSFGYSVENNNHSAFPTHFPAFL